MARRLCVLWVEDDSVFYEHMVRAIARAAKLAPVAAMDFMHAESKQAAHRRVAERRFDRLIIDVCLGRYPDLSGMEFLEELRAEGNMVPALILSGELTLGLQKRARALGAVDFLKKGALHDAQLLAEVVADLGVSGPGLARIAPIDGGLADEFETLPGKPVTNLQKLEDRLVLRAKEKESSLSAAARRFGSSRQTFVKKLKKLLG